MIIALSFLCLPIWKHKLNNYFHDLITIYFLKAVILRLVKIRFENFKTCTNKSTSSYQAIKTRKNIKNRKQVPFFIDCFCLLSFLCKGSHHAEWSVIQVYKQGKILSSTRFFNLTNAMSWLVFDSSSFTLKGSRKF